MRYFPGGDARKEYRKSSFAQGGILRLALVRLTNQMLIVIATKSGICYHGKCRLADVNERDFARKANENGSMVQCLRTVIANR